MTYTEAYRHYLAALRENPRTPPPALRMETTYAFHAWKAEMRAYDAVRLELKLATAEEIQSENSVVGTHARTVANRRACALPLSASLPTLPTFFAERSCR